MNNNNKNERLNLNSDLCTKLVHDMAKLVEVGLHLIVLHQGGSISCRFAEVGHHGCHSHLSSAIWQQTTRLQAKAGGMSILPLSEEGQNNWLFVSIKLPSNNYHLIIE